MIPWGTLVAKAILWKITDTETRKLGERSRLETCVVLALNVCLLAAPVPTQVVIDVAKVTR